MTLDQRRVARVKVRLKARYYSPATEFESTITSLSDGGLFLYSTKLDPEGTPARLEFGLNELGRTIHATGEVIYTGFQDGLRGMGIRFNRLVDEDREAIQGLVRSGSASPTIN